LSRSGVAVGADAGEETGVEWQSATYVDGLPDELEPAIEGGLSFVYESTGTEARFTNRLDADPASRPLFSFHRPETLAGWLDEVRRHPTAPTLRHRLRSLPPLEPTGLWPAQHTAIANLERSLAANRPRALIQMATGCRPRASPRRSRPLARRGTAGSRRGRVADASRTRAPLRRAMRRDSPR